MTGRSSVPAGRWLVPVTADGAIVQDGFRPREGDRMVRVVVLADVLGSLRDAQLCDAADRIESEFGPV